MPAPTLVMATRNPGKVRELQEILKDTGVSLLSLADFPDLPEIPEEGATFAENAATKALAVARLTGHPGPGRRLRPGGGRPGRRPRGLLRPLRPGPDRPPPPLMPITGANSCRR